MKEHLTFLETSGRQGSCCEVNDSICALLRQGDEEFRHYCQPHVPAAGSIEFALCLERCTLSVNGAATPLEKGDVLIVTAMGGGCRIRGIPEQSVPPCEYLCIDPQGLQECLHPVYINFKSLRPRSNKAFRYLLPQTDYPMVSWLMQRTLQEFREQKENYQMVVRGMVVSLLVEILRCNEDFTGNVCFFSKEIQEIYPALRLLNQLDPQSENVDYLAALCHMSPSHFRRRFKQIMGESVASYLTNQRLNQACELLLNSDESVLTVAMAAGFESLSSFNKLFGECLGESPSRWRRRMCAKG